MIMNSEMVDMNSEMVDMNSEMVVMNKFGMDFMNKFELGDMSIEEFFSEDWDLINDVVNILGSVNNVETTRKCN